MNFVKLALKNGGTTWTVLFVSDRSTDDILTFTVSIPFDLTSTVTFVEEINVSSVDSLSSGVKISDIGHKMYFVGGSGSKVFSADLIY
jgi:hypothetical protein